MHRARAPLRARRARARCLSRRRAHLPIPDAPDFRMISVIVSNFPVEFDSKRTGIPRDLRIFIAHWKFASALKRSRVKSAPPQAPEDTASCAGASGASREIFMISEFSSFTSQSRVSQRRLSLGSPLRPNRRHRHAGGATNRTLWGCCYSCALAVRHGRLGAEERLSLIR